MTKYVIVYLGGDPPPSQEAGRKHFAKYLEWLASLREAAVSPANPLKNTHTLNPDGTQCVGGKSAMSGYTIIEAASMEDALELARSCPFLEVGGSLEVSELGEMPGLK